MEIQGGKFLTFLLGQEIYGIPIAKVKEIIGMIEITPIPETQGYIKGVINLWGKIIPIVDLWLKFDVETLEDIEHTCIIVIKMTVSENQRLVGIMVDSVSEVISIVKKDIEPPPEYEARSEGDFLSGLGKLKGKVILILDSDKILNREELSYIEHELIQT
jgi:purine-binding chemotaxis protein CheW